MDIKRINETLDVFLTEGKVPISKTLFLDITSDKSSDEVIEELYEIIPNCIDYELNYDFDSLDMNIELEKEEDAKVSLKCLVSYGLNYDKLEEALEDAGFSFDFVDTVINY